MWFGQRKKKHEANEQCKSQQQNKSAAECKGLAIKVYLTYNSEQIDSHCGREMTTPGTTSLHGGQRALAQTQTQKKTGGDKNIPHCEEVRRERKHLYGPNKYTYISSDKYTCTQIGRRTFDKPVERFESQPRHSKTP